MADTVIRHAYADTPRGQVHYASVGEGPPLLCLHQTPRSSDEYRELMPLLAMHHRVIAMDTPGMGASDALNEPASIELYAEAALSLLDDIGVERVDVIGHHTGGVIGIELAASAPLRVGQLVLSSTAFIDHEARRVRRARRSIDSVDTRNDGAHLIELWNRRRACYPADRTDLMERVLRDILSAHDPDEGHSAVGRYQMELRCPLIVAPTLCIGASADPYSFGDLGRLVGAIAGSRSAVISGGTVGLLEDKAPEVAALVLTHLANAPRSQQTERENL